jgi:DNA mismatch endonuclease (patch repair protein)
MAPAQRTYETLPTAGRARNMRANKRRDTAPEQAVRRLLHASGARYRVDFPIRIAGALIRPDIVFPRLGIAIFIDGCFWHACPLHGQTPASNASYWVPKLRENMERDNRQTRLLKGEGWRVLRYWQHEHPQDVVRAIIKEREDRALALGTSQAGRHPIRAASAAHR